MMLQCATCSRVYSGMYGANDVVSGVLATATTFFDIEYLRNDTRWSHSYHRTLTGSHMRSIE